MAKRGIDVEIRGRNALGRALSGATRTLRRWGKSAARTVRRVGLAFVGLAAGAVAFGVKALRAFEPQERALSHLRSAFRAYNEDVDAGIATVQRFTNAMQKQVGVGNETLELRAAELRQYGVLTDDLEAATKATVALTQSGMNEQMATKAIAAAYEGSFESLTRYIPALRTATDDAEKAAIVNDFLTRKYKEAEDETQTFSGQLRVLREAMEDAWKEAGKAGAEHEGLNVVIQDVIGWVEKLGAKIAEWVGSGGLMRAAQTAEFFFTEVKNSFLMLGNSAKVVFAGIADTSETIITYVTQVIKAFIDTTVNGFDRMGRVAKASWEMVRRPGRRTYRDLRAAMSDAVDGQIEDAKKLAKALMGEDAAVTKRTEAALVEREQLQRDYDNAIQSIEEKQAQRFEQARENEVKETEDALTEIEVARENHAKRIEQLEKKREQIQSQIADKEKQQAQGRIDDLRRIQSEYGNLANMTVRQAREQERAEKNAARDFERRDHAEQRRAESIRRRLDAGGHVGDRAREFLQARERLEQARQAPDEIRRAEKALEETTKQTKSMDDMKKELVNIDKNLQQLLKSGGA